MRRLILAGLIALPPAVALARAPMETNQLVDGNGNPVGTADNPLVVGGAPSTPAGPTYTTPAPSRPVRRWSPFPGHGDSDLERRAEALLAPGPGYGSRPHRLRQHGVFGRLPPRRRPHRHEPGDDADLVPGQLVGILGLRAGCGVERLRGARPVMRPSVLALLGVLLPVAVSAQDVRSPPGLQSGGTGDASNVFTQAPSGSITRSLSDRLRDAASANDYGAAPGGADIGSALTGALNNTVRDGSAPVTVRLGRSGFYAVNSNWTYSSAAPVVLETGWGVNYGGSKGFSGLQYDIYKGHEKPENSDVPSTETSRFFDYGANNAFLLDAGWGSTTVRQSHILKWATGNANQSAYSQVGHGVFARVPDLSAVLPGVNDASKPFEKDAIRGYIRTEAGAAAQSVGVMGRSDIATPATDALGRPAVGVAWGGNFDARVLSGSDGYSVGVEINNQNFGSVSKTIGGYDKIGLKLVPHNMGNPITAAIFVQGNAPGGYYTTLHVDPASIINDPVSRFIKLPSLFEVMRDGTLMVGKGTPDATARGTGVQINPNGSMSLANYSGATTLVIDGPANQQRGMEWRTSGVLAWNFVVGNDGNSDLAINSLDNSGNYTATPLVLRRLAGRVEAPRLSVSTAMWFPFGTVPSATSSCTAGQFQIDATYIYSCVATNSWRRLANGAAW